jgi:hypothetical protein
MSPTSRKTNPNVPLQIAIVESRQKRYVIARKAKLTPDRLSQITNGRGVPARAGERKALARVLGRQIEEIFPASELAVPA